MAAPPTTVRSAPTGFKLPDGYQTTISFALKPTVQFWERSVKPPGIDGGDPIDTTTMWNVSWRTRYARHLKTLTDCSGEAAYDPDCIPDLFAIINNVGGITIAFPDSSTLTFWGFLQKVEFGENKEGEMPVLNYTIVPTNQDPGALGGTEPPVYTPAAGT
jgi:hypothetical protein